jgi:enamine deaminase RidA (YjgF/YER057c/UK114 family)
MKMKNGIVLVGLLCLQLTALGQKIDFDKKFESLGIVLPKIQPPVATYVKAVRSGNLLFLSGHGPAPQTAKKEKGKVGRDLTIDEGYDAARATAISMLATLQFELTDLNKVKRIVKVLGMVNCTEDFYDQPKVINGFSDTMVAVFGDKGKHARSAVGMYALPFNYAVEVEMVVEVE